MTKQSRNPAAATADGQPAAPGPADRGATRGRGLSPDELRAERAGDLPDREAMSVMSLGGVGIDVPPADHLDDFLRGIPPIDTPPTDGPGGSWPIDPYPLDGAPVPQPPIEVAPGDPVAAPVDDDTLISVPDLPRLTDDTTTEA